MTENKRIDPVIIYDAETDQPKYTLDFNRKTIRKAEQGGFTTAALAQRPLTASQDFFYLAFLMHQPWIKKDQTDELLDELGGISNDELFRRLLKLYDQGMTSLSDDKAKNARVALKL